MREKYESLSASVLHELAKARGLKGTSSMKKSELITRMLGKRHERDAREGGGPGRGAIP